MANKHTAGPWKMRAGKEGSIILIEDGQRSSVIAFMQGYGEELNANARLIATSPELLEACKYMQEHDGECSEDTREKGRALLKAAIDKAEGQ